MALGFRVFGVVGSIRAEEFRVESGFHRIWALGS